MLVTFKDGSETKTFALSGTVKIEAGYSDKTSWIGLAREHMGDYYYYDDKACVHVFGTHFEVSNGEVE